MKTDVAHVKANELIRLKREIESELCRSESEPVDWAKIVSVVWTVYTVAASAAELWRLFR